MWTVIVKVLIKDKHSTIKITLKLKLHFLYIYRDLWGGEGCLAKLKNKLNLGAIRRYSVINFGIPSCCSLWNLSVHTDGKISTVSTSMLMLTNIYALCGICHTFSSACYIHFWLPQSYNTLLSYGYRVFTTLLSWQNHSSVAFCNIL